VWLHNIRIAQEIGANKLDTMTTQLQDAMVRWLSRGHKVSASTLGLASLIVLQDSKHPRKASTVSPTQEARHQDVTFKKQPASDTRHYLFPLEGS